MGLTTLLTTLFLNISAFIMAVTPTPTYTEGIVGRPQSFFSAHAKTPHEKTVSTLIFRGLFKYDIYGEIVPDLAETWTISEDGLVYTIKLKPNQLWTNGQPITADDLIYTAFTTPDLAGVATDKVDDLTVRYTLPNKYAPFLSLLSGGIMHEGSAEEENSLKPISNGDWRVVAIEKSGDRVNRVVLRTRNPDFAISKIVFRYYSNDKELVTAAKIGEIDGFLSEHSYQIENFNNHQFPLQGIYYAIFFNLQNEKLKDVTLRQRLEHVLDKPKLVYDRGILVNGPISRSLYTDESLEFNKFDPSVTDELADINLNVVIPDIPEHNEFFDRITKVWEESLGVEVTLSKVSSAEIVDKIINPRSFDVLFYGQEVGRDPDRYINWHSTQKAAPGLNLSQFEHLRADRALEEGRNNYEYTARQIHYNEFQKAVIENVPAIFLYHPYLHFYVSKYIDGVGQKYTFTQPDRFLDLQNWRRVATN